MTTEEIAGLSEERLRWMLAGLEDTEEGDVMTWRAFSPASLRSLITELLALREVIDLVREEAAKDNAPFGRADSLALARIRTALSMLPARALSHNPEPMK